MKYFLIYSNCVLTKGKNRSTITDLQNKELYILPNDICQIILDLKKEPLIDVMNTLDNKSQDILMEYLNYYLKEGIGFYTEQPKMFPNIDLTFYSPEIINNAIIDIDVNSSFNLTKIVSELTELKCKFLEIRAYCELSIKRIKEIVMFASNGFFRNINFIIKYPNNEDDLKTIKNMLLDFPLIGTITFHTAPKNYNDSFFVFIEKQIKNESCCGVINQDYFSPDLSVFSESQQHNSCLNKKIAIDVNGSIKNCPSMPKSFGNIKNVSLKQALNKKDFKKYWNITKDQISVCKDCEFRYICTDCRAYTENPQDIYSKPLKCGYDPYTNTWETWSKNPLKEKAITYYGMSHLINTND